MNQIYSQYLIVGVIVFLFFSLFIFYMSIHPHKFISNNNPSEIGLKYEEVTITTDDDIKLNAWFIPNNNSDKAIIITHGYPFDKGNVLSFGEFLKDDYNLIFFDFRYFGKSTGKYTTVGINEVKDINAVVDYLEEKNISQIGGLGFSLGASTLLLSNNPKISAIVADSPYASLERMLEQSYKVFWIFKKPFVLITKLYVKLFLGVSINEANLEEKVKSNTAPALLIHGTKDSQIPFVNSKIINSSLSKSELWIVEDADHGEAHYKYQKEYEDRVLEFFNNNIK